ncbi:uncharacterized protein LOC133850058 [Drosophila sulfurigaster albostrigata]|uniref:uncharacterized protein LOC133850058 n=1 Tax=Drosophila sulfurigaster albostrigata TaxID=89887 RepID=UPI002D21A2BF|nr:uncharacterized protein LOC133850058 [Drosophila sulfurigaster albostrigata]XP_062142004.1 uncharacterized protein LOC133850058 [Drosophila sulfurigaster albostrigata]
MTSSRNQSLAQSTETQARHRLQLPQTLQLPLPMLLLLLMVLLLVATPLQPCESRYLPTRSHGDELDKLRELMLQILELSNEDPQNQQQQQQQQQPLQQHQMRLHNEANNPLNGQQRASNAAWLQKLGAMGALDTEGAYGRY